MSTTGPCCTAARLAGSIAGVPGLADSGALLTVADRGLTVRLTRDLWWLESRHIELARAVSAVARAHGAPADRTAVQEVQLAIAAKPDAIDVGFWRAVLGYDPMSDDNAVNPLGHGSTVWMQEPGLTSERRWTSRLSVRPSPANEGTGTPRRPARCR